MKEEQKYYVDLDTAAYVAKWNGNDQVDIYTDGISGSDEFEFHLTEQEIKDYDERYWAFAEPVEEEPLYHALIKGHELVRNSSKYWIHDTEYQGDVFVGHRIQMLPRFKERLTMPDWNELGINDSNADFVKVDK